MNSDIKAQRITCDRVRQIYDLPWRSDAESQWALRKFSWLLTIGDEDHGLYENLDEALYSLLIHTYTEPSTWRLMVYHIFTDEAALLPFLEENLDSTDLGYTDFTGDPDFKRFQHLLAECEYLT